MKRAAIQDSGAIVDQDAATGNSDIDFRRQPQPEHVTPRPRESTAAGRRRRIAGIVKLVRVILYSQNRIRRRWSDLHAAFDRINRAIEALPGPKKRRGRPPKNPLPAFAPASALPPAKRKRRTFTAAQRKQQAARMRQYWAAKRKATKKGA